MYGTDETQSGRRDRSVHSTLACGMESELTDEQGQRGPAEPHDGHGDHCEKTFTPKRRRTTDECKSRIDLLGRDAPCSSLLVVKPTAVTSFLLTAMLRLQKQNVKCVEDGQVTGCGENGVS
ncbi:uncharacterized protein SPSK_04675 [Sporothrix schenckii 1099-18]|uniref:Uncharacterized protein n=1 Tax=Sporothrix schenckii 1099-18 TaxID=1397361 RepID=A0A0F2M332_SPOSC|nr:uncharacterized protein SPSK_04675 [Sporothrix schenckii 1099-18]KJR83170.1 hypothetical protein SPSK_04675 [Sporothrix schenckii 1099-18]